MFVFLLLILSSLFRYQNSFYNFFYAFSIASFIRKVNKNIVKKQILKLCKYDLIKKWHPNIRVPLLIVELLFRKIF